MPLSSPVPFSTAAIASAMLQASLDGIVAIDQDNVVVEWNPAAERTFGWTREEALGRSLSELIVPPAYREAHERGMKRYLSTRVPHLLNHRVQVEAQRRSGEIFACEIAFHPLEFAGRTYFAAYLRDVSGQIRSDQERRRLALVAEASTDFIAFSDAEHRLQYINAAGRRLIGYERELAPGTTFADLVHPDDRELLVNQAWEDVRRQGRWAGEMRLVHQLTGESIAVHRTIFTLNDETTGACIGYATVTRDIRESKRIEQERAAWQTHLEQQVSARTQELRDLNTELDAFNYSLSHDLRAPIRHISGFAALLRRSLESGDLDRGRHYLNAIEQAAARMGTLVEAMLGLARQARTPLRRVPVDLACLVRRVQNELAADLEQRRLRWIVGELPVVLGDPVLLEQVLLNVLGNAVKYTRTRPEAQVEVRARLEGAEWIVEVRDNGVGFDPRFSGKLFGVFQRLHLDHEFEGIGVGLANVQRLIKRHGGRVWASSALGEGATFAFSLPAGPLDERSAE
ncbi:hypothetical protein DKM44_12595 [Deinococcus irradiatisoli]|uniref:histidine kinase n=1 Tax=Deinococcus irradiatisoli TaxID=2202254 RepID=A0A2Z3JG15_9DEIO|nr:PAS domain S-box protein [Deinococcus irradiatisoli]AWN23962.1 hypothetical protein DKM44_12595 [Deinococcus irradiatisoli]